MLQERIRQADGKEMIYYVWPAEQEEAVLQIVYGASEEALRYREFAEWLNQRGVTVYIMDNRGHGLNREEEGYVHIQPEKWHSLVEDVKTLGEKIKMDRGKKPYLLGHSMGSLISRIVAQEGADYEKFFFTGTTWSSGGMIKFGLGLSELLILINGVKYEDPIFERMTFETFRTEMIARRLTSSRYGWLTRDMDKLKEAEGLSCLQERFSLGAHRTLIFLVRESQKREKYAQIKAPIHFLSGSNDPVGKFSKAVRKACSVYEKEANVPVFCHLYDGMHHEILNERGREEVYEDILYFMKKD